MWSHILAVEPDPVDIYLEETARSCTIFPSLKRPFSEVDCSPSTSESPSSAPPSKRIRRSERHLKTTLTPENTNLIQKHSTYEEIRRKVTCGEL